jgi:hypothetical protein
MSHSLSLPLSPIRNQTAAAESALGGTMHRPRLHP